MHHMEYKNIYAYLMYKINICFKNESKSYDGNICSIYLTNFN